MLYAKIYDDAGTLRDTGDRIDLDAPPLARGDLAPGKPWWVPLVTEVSDTSTTPHTVREVVITIEEARVLRSVTIRDKTAQEIDADRTAIVDGRFAAAGSIDRALAEIVFEQENRIRALEGRPAVTAAQFKTYIKNKMG